MKSIDTLVDDIYKLMLDKPTIAEEYCRKFSHVLGNSIIRRFGPEEKFRDRKGLRASNIGTKCDRKLFYEHSKVDYPVEELPANAHIKFMFGDILEELLFFLAEAAGHNVTGLSDRMEYGGIVGHRDGIIDGVLVDVKSCSSFSFKKFTNHLTHANDDFGYIDQLQFYLHACQNDPLVLDKTRAAFFVIDKTLGSIALDFHALEDYNLQALIDHKKAVIVSDTVPERLYEDEPMGKSGNMKLGAACSYCNRKQTCWPEAKAYYYSTGPVYLTKVVKEPRVDV